jgi:hypothetical protein
MMTKAGAEGHRCATADAIFVLENAGSKLAQTMVVPIIHHAFQIFSILNKQHADTKLRIQKVTASYSALVRAFHNTGEQ